MIEKAAFTYHVEEFLKESSSYLVDVIIAAGNKVTVEIDNDNGVHIEECVELSRYLESQFNRDEEDFELIVTSFGLTSPFKSLRQYKKYEGKEVEVLTKDGRKLSGILSSSDSEGFTLTVKRRVKPEGAKRKIEIEEDLRFVYEEIKQTKYLIQFK